jgi:hypothetical protein
MAPARIPTVMSTDAWSDYRVPGSPYFVLVDGTRPAVLGEGTGTAWSQVSNLVSSALADAGLGRDGAAKPRVQPRDDRDRGHRVESDLRNAGIEPGHPSLNPGDRRAGTS